MPVRFLIPALMLTLATGCGPAERRLGDFKGGDKLQLTGTGDLYWLADGNLMELKAGSDTPTTHQDLAGDVHEFEVSGEFAYLLHTDSAGSTERPDLVSRARLAGGAPEQLVELPSAEDAHLVGVIGERVYYKEQSMLFVVGTVDPIAMNVFMAAVAGDRLVVGRWRPEQPDQFISVDATGGDAKVLLEGNGFTNGRLLPGKTIVAVASGYSSYWFPLAGGEKQAFPEEHIPLAVSGDDVFLNHGHTEMVRWKSGTVTPLESDAVYAAAANGTEVLYTTDSGLFSIAYQ